MLIKLNVFPFAHNDVQKESLGVRMITVKETYTHFEGDYTH